MGIENNEAILATTYNDELVEEIRRWIFKNVPTEFQGLFVFIPSIVNSETTIVMAPNGSKKGWDTAEEGDRIRAAFIEKINSYAYTDGSNPFDYVEVGYGEYGQKILNGNCKNMYSDDDYAI